MFSTQEGEEIEKGSSKEKSLVEDLSEGLEEEHEELVKSETKPAKSVETYANYIEAIEKGNKEEVERLLQKEPLLLNQLNSKGFTPLMVAILKDQEEIVRCLLAKGAQTDVKDNQGKTAEDYAKEKRLDLKTVSLQIFKHALGEAYSNKQYEEQCTLISQLAKCYLEKQEYSSAAKLLNGALAITEEHSTEIDDSIKDKLLAELKEIEPRFIKEKLGIDYKATIEAYGINPKHKEKLLQIREIVRERLKEYPELSILSDEETSNRIQQMFKWITQEINELLDGIAQDCISLMSTRPPCDYALIGTGSLAREEMTPYSDLECFLLISESAVKNKEYFKQFSQLFEFKIINLRETDLVKGQDLLPLNMPSPVRRKFSLDVHKNPMEKEYELIGTPEELAKYQLPEYYVEASDNHLSIALLNTVLITGANKELLMYYQSKVKEVYQIIKPSTQQPLRLFRSLRALKLDSPT